MTVSVKDISETIKKAGLVKKSVCIHSSLRSFGGIKGGADTVIKAFLDSGCTVMVPTFSFSYAVFSPEGMRFKRNGVDYADLSWIKNAGDAVFTAGSKEIDDDMGALPLAVLAENNSVRGNHPLCSFTAIGPYAHELIKSQSPMDVYAPLRELALFQGHVLLMGVGVDKMTALHLAEQMAGRNMFVRWAMDSTGKIITAEVGGDSAGFVNLDPYINHLDKKEQCGESVWRAFPVNKVLKQAARVIQLKPEITHCADVKCLRCNDAVAGGPVLL